MNLMMLLEMATQVAGERVAFGPAEGGLTYQQLFDRAGGAARRLQEDEVGTLAFVGTATDAFPTAVFAAAWAGVPLAPLNYRLSDEQLTALLARLDRPKIVADREFVERLRALGAEVGAGRRLGRRGRGHRSRRPLGHGPDGGGAAPLHQRDDRRAQGRRPPPGAPLFVRARLGGVRVGRRDGGGAGQRAAVPHRRRVQRGVERVLEPPGGPPAAVRPRGLAGHREGRSRDPRPGRAHHAGPGRRPPRRPAPADLPALRSLAYGGAPCP